MKVLVAHSFYRVPGGEDHYVRQQVEALSSRHEVELLERDNSRLKASPATWSTMVAGFPRRDGLEGVFDRFAPDVVHLHNAYPSLGPMVHRAASKRGIPIVMTVHNFRLRCPNGYMFTNGEVCRRCEGGNYANAVVNSCFETRVQAAGYASALWIHRFVTRLESQIDRFIAPSEFTARRLHEWSIAPERITVVRNFTDLPEAPTFEPGTFGLYLGRMSPEKGLDTLVDALALAGDPEFVFAGDGPELESLRNRAASRGLSKARFVGRRNRAEVADLTRGARFVVMPSRSEENAPLAALEAMAHGKALIASDLGGLTELVADGQGVAVAQADARDLSAAISRLMNDAEACAAFGKAGRVFAEAHLTAQAHVDALDRCYSEVVARKF